MAVSRRNLLKSAAAVARLQLPAKFSRRRSRRASRSRSASWRRAPASRRRRARPASAPPNGRPRNSTRQGGIGGRKIELIIEEESSPKDTIERFSKLVQQEKVDCVQGIVSTGVGLALGPVVEESRALTIYWDGTTQDGVDEKIPNPKYLFRSTDNECEAMMASLLAIKYWKGKFVTVAGINPDYSYGRNNMAAFIALLKRYNIEHKVVTEQWPKVGTMDLTSHVAALKAAKPDLIFSSLLFADLPVFMKQAHAADLTKGTKLVFPAAGWQHTLMKKEFTPEGMLFGHNTLYFANPKGCADCRRNSSPGTTTSTRTIPNWEADRAYFALASYKAAVEKAMKAKGGSWPTQDDVIEAMGGLSVESLGGKGSWRKDHIADQTFVQGLTTHKNKLRLRDARPSFDTMYSTDLQKPRGREFLGVDQDREFQGSRVSPHPRMSCAFRQHPARRRIFTPPSCFSSRPGCSSCSACRRSSISRAARSTRSARISASRSSAMRAALGVSPWLLLPVLLRRRHADRPHRPADRAAAALRL